MADEGRYVVTGLCYFCGKPFVFHPHKVPSIPIKNGKPDPSGTRQPICKTCVDRANPIRRVRGLPEITYTKDAYDVALEEGEL